MDERVWWHDREPDWWEKERRDTPLFLALAARDPFADPPPAVRDALESFGGFLEGVVREWPRPRDEAPPR